MQLEIEDIKKVVEYNLREIGNYKDELENGWKESISTPNGETIVLKTNLQKLRDVIAQSILDILTNVQVTGNLTSGNVKGTVTKISENDKIVLDKDIEHNGTIKTEKVEIGSTQVAIKGGKVDLLLPAGSIVVQTAYGPASNTTPLSIPNAGTIKDGSGKVLV